MRIQVLAMHTRCSYAIAENPSNEHICIEIAGSGKPIPGRVAQPDDQRELRKRNT